MATYFAAQLKDMFFVLVERVTGYGWGEGQDAAGTKESKVTSADQVSETDEEEVAVVQNIQIRARSGDPFVSGGTKPQPSAPARRVGVRTSRRESSAASRGGVHLQLHRAVNGRVSRHSQTRCPCRTFKKGGKSPLGYSHSQNHKADSKSQVNRSSTSPCAVTSGEGEHTDTARHGGRGARDHLRAGAAEGGGGDGGVGAHAAEEARRREGGAPAPALHAAVVRRRQRRGDAEDSGRGGGRERGQGLGRLCCLPVLRVAGRLHRELPQEPGLRDHLRPPRHGGVRGGRGGGADDGQLAVQEAGHDGDRGGGGGVRGRGHVRRGVRVGLQRAQQDRPDVHAGVQRLRRLPHRQHRRGALLRGRAPGLVRRHLSMHTYMHRLDRQYKHRASIYR